MLKNLCRLFFLIVYSITQAQGEANNWYFGNQVGITFNNGSVEVLMDGVLITTEGCATLSNNSGQLLFYTDGITIWNKNHQIMLNGSGLNGHFSSTHSAIIIPHPNDSDLYYVFTVDFIGFSNDEIQDSEGLQYSIVDMTLDSGLGGVTAQKNILLEKPTTEKLAVIEGINSNEYWLLSHRWQSSDFIAYKIDGSGINPNPVVSSVGTIIGDQFSTAIGTIKASSDGSKVAVANAGHPPTSIPTEVQLFDFDKSTGILSNPVTISNEVPLPFVSTSFYGIEFSSNNQYLYVTQRVLENTLQWQHRNYILQYDVTQILSQDIIDSRTEIFSLFTTAPNLIVEREQLGALQLAVDGKIYLATNGEYLGVINNPNEFGINCNYEHNGVFLNGRTSNLGLPPFVNSLIIVGFQANDVCDGDEVVFNSNVSQAYDTLVWNFGDGNTSTEENPTHTYATAGNYEVLLTVIAGTYNSTDSKIVNVYEVPTVVSTVTLTQCDEDLDGYSNFNLTEVNAEISDNYQNETITFYETQTNAELNENPISDSANYTNQSVSNDIIWARVENNFGCYSTSQVNLVVSTTQIPNSFMRDFYACDNDIDTTDGISTFDFSSANAEIEALFPAGQQLDINYYRNEIDALLETNPISDISNYQNIGYPDSQNIYVRVENALNNDCIGLGYHITLHVESLPLVTGPVIIEQCDDGNDGTEFFDTSSIENELLIGQTQNIIFTYEDEFGNALPSPLPNPFEVSESIVNIFATMTATDTNNNCNVQTTITFSINSSVNIYPVDTFVACDTDLNGQHTFDTSTLEVDLFGTPQPDTQISYTDGNGDPIPSPFPNSFTTGTQTITASVENTINPDCNATYNVEFVVVQQPIANSIENDFVCDDMSNDGQHLFTLPNYDTQILDTQSSSVFEVFYFESQTDALSSLNVLLDAYTVNSTSQTIFARIENRNHPECFEITSFEIGVNYSPVAYTPENLNLCDFGNDGSETIDLTNQDESVLNGQSATNNIISYYLTSEDAEAGLNAQSNNFTNTSNPQTIYTRIENSNSSECYAVTSFEIILNEQPELLMDDIWSICEGEIVDVFADEGYDYYNWSSGQTTRIITVDEPGIYTVIASNVYGNLTCSAEKTITVNISDIAIISDIEIEDWSQSNNSISVFAEGNGEYEYSIDGINYQDVNIFNGLSIDDYTIYVRDKNGCGIVSEDVYLLYYPRFFTPNGDGNNDFWQIKNSAREPLNKLYIYNRYGKLITQLKPNDYGWDGTLNGSKLPSSDYWFVLERQNGKIYNGHFTLKR